MTDTLCLKKIVRVDRVWLDESHPFKKRPPGGGKYYRFVVDGTCAGCERHQFPGRHLEYLKLPFHSISDARRHVDELSVDLRRGRVAVVGNVTTREWLEEWRDEWIGDVTPRTREAYVQIVDSHLIPGLGDIPLAQLDDAAINSFYRGQTAKGLGPSTVQKHHVILAMALKMAVKKGRIRHNPADTDTNDIRLPSAKDAHERSSRHKALTDEQIGLLLSLVSGRRDIEVPVALAVLAGLRAQEILALRWSDVDFDASLLHIERALEQTSGENGAPVLRLKSPKSKAGRRAVPMVDALSTVLVRWHDQRAAEGLSRGLGDRPVAPSALIFPDDRAGGCDPDALMPRTVISHRWARWKHEGDNAAVFGDTTFHDLRHTAASHWLRHGEPLFRVSRWLGHATIGITANIYGDEEPTSEDAKRMSERQRGVIDARRGMATKIPKEAVGE